MKHLVRRLDEIEPIRPVRLDSKSTARQRRERRRQQERERQEAEQQEESRC